MADTVAGNWAAGQLGSSWVASGQATVGFAALMSRAASLGNIRPGSRALRWALHCPLWGPWRKEEVDEKKNITWNKGFCVFLFDVEPSSARPGVGGGDDVEAAVLASQTQPPALAVSVPFVSYSRRAVLILLQKRQRDKRQVVHVHVHVVVWCGLRACPRVGYRCGLREVR